MLLQDLEFEYIKYREKLALDKLENKNYYVVDVISRSLIIVTSIPAYLFGLSNANIGHLTTLKGYMQQNSTVKNIRSYGQRLTLNASSGCAGLFIKCGWADKDSKNQDVVDYTDDSCCCCEPPMRKNTFILDTKIGITDGEVENMINIIKKEYAVTGGLKHIIESKFDSIVYNKDNKVEWREKRWNDQVKDNLIINRVNFQVNRPLIAPPLPYDPPPPYNPDSWSSEAIKDKHLVDMLSGELDVTNVSLPERLNNYNNLMYSKYYSNPGNSSSIPSNIL